MQILEHEKVRKIAKNGIRACVYQKKAVILSP